MSVMPNFFIVGAARSGTTSLDRYLSQHPDIYITPRKETHFLADTRFPTHFTGPGDERLNRLLVRDEKQYAQLFADVKGARAIGESSAFYLCFSGTAERIAETVPDAKILILLREPVARAYSSYMMLIRDGRETLGFEDGLGKEEERRQQGFEPMWWYKALSLYSSQVKRYLDVFGEQHVKVLFYEELFAMPERVLRDVFAFLGVNDDVTINTSVRYNVSGPPKSRKLYSLLDTFIYNPGPLAHHLKSLLPKHMRITWASKVMNMSLRSVPLDSQMHLRLKEDFAEDVRKLEALLHRDVLCWHYQKSAGVQEV